MIALAVLIRQKELRTILHLKPPIIVPTEPIYKFKNNGETEAENENELYELLQEKKVDWENKKARVRERGSLRHNFPWDEVDTKVRSYIFLCLGAQGEKQVQQERPGLEIHAITKKELQQ